MRLLFYCIDITFSYNFIDIRVIRDLYRSWFSKISITSTHYDATRRRRVRFAEQIFLHYSGYISAAKTIIQISSRGFLQQVCNISWNAISSFRSFAIRLLLLYTFSNLARVLHTSVPKVFVQIWLVQPLPQWSVCKRAALFAQLQRRPRTRHYCHFIHRLWTI